MATAAMTIYLALGFGIGIGLWLSELDEERERVLSEIGVASLSHSYRGTKIFRTCPIGQRRCGAGLFPGDFT